MRPFVTVPTPLWQVMAIDVETDKPTYVGPAMSHPKVLYQLAEAINKGAANGTERRWREAQVRQLSTTRS